MGSAVASYRDLLVWQAAVDLAVACYSHTGSFPRNEEFGLTSQIRRAATSIAANIAEGNGRESTGVYVQFLRISQGSLKELETHLIVATKVGMMNEEAAAGLLKRTEDIGKMLRALIRTLQKRS